MSDYIRKVCIRSIIIFLCVATSTIFSEVIRPRLAVIFVVDQFSYAYINELRSKLYGGLGFLLQKGVNYDNAVYPHAKPATATGHVALNTGVFAKDHGVVGNKWFDSSGKKVCFADVGTDADALVFNTSGKGTFDFARSANMIMVPGVSDMFMLNAKASETNQVYALSFKDRAAIGLAGKLGKAVWYEGKNGHFTSSKAYFDELPAWIQAFNKEKRIDRLKTVSWNSVYGIDTSFYKFKEVSNYQFSDSASMINTDVVVYKPDQEHPYDDLVLTPYANDLLCDLAERCVQEILCGQKDTKLVLWVSLSSLDKLGHIFGPYAAEQIDLVYHLDKRIKRFIKTIQKKVKKQDTLFILTADHGVSPIPEILQEQGLKSAVRINGKQLLSTINKAVEDAHGIKKLCIHEENHQFFVDHCIFDTLSRQKKDEVCVTVKTVITKQPGIKQVWTYGELQDTVFQRDALQNFFKNQLYPGRSGEFIVQVEPYCVISDYPKGTSHATPYQYDTHVPLVLYQKGRFEGKTVKERVSMLQVANTLAEILQVPKPPASTFDILPELFDPLGEKE